MQTKRKNNIQEKKIIRLKNTKKNNFCHSYFCYFVVRVRGIITESNSTCFVTNITTLG